MLDLVTTTQFRKDLKRIRKRGYDLSKLDDILQKLRAEEPLLEKNRDHDLTGDYKGFRECHVEPDWLLVYAVDKEKSYLSPPARGRIPIYFDGLSLAVFFLAPMNFLVTADAQTPKISLVIRGLPPDD